jgi:simple sugar transport system ATP-binding protein
VLSAHSVVKRYGSTLALAGVDFHVGTGEIVGLVGANGAGKSTLISILSGWVPPTHGRLELGGTEVRFTRPEDATRAGIATVHQDVDQALVLTQSVAENLVLDQIVAGALGALPSARRVRDAARQIPGHALNLDTRVERLSTSQKQQLLIARALHRGARVLILDEPTAALSVNDQRDLHERLRALAATGTAIIYITHHLGEVSALCDRVVAIREGAVAGEFLRPVDTKAVIGAMLGSLVERPARAAAVTSIDSPKALELRGVRTRVGGEAFDLTVREGEVLGITGLLGSGKTELLRQVVGADPLIDGDMLLAGGAHAPRSRRESVRAGVGFVPEDRRSHAELTEWDVAENVTIPDLRRYKRWGLLDGRAETRAATSIIDTLRIAASGPRAALSSLSGGNRQKVMVGRWIAAGSSLLVLDEPFRGVDLGARADLAGLLRSHTVNAAIVASSDPEEILEVADRILVFADGRPIAEVLPADVDVETLAHLMVTAIDSLETTE